MKTFRHIISIISIVAAANSAMAGNTLNLNVECANKTQIINDGYATAHVSGGEAPYTYHWSKTDSGLNDSVSYGLTEGNDYSVKVFDAKGDSAEAVFQVRPEVVGEKINSWFAPIVDAGASVILGDLFAKLGLYDNVIYDEQGNPILNPNGTPKTMRIPFVVVWLILGAIFCTVYFGFPNLRCVKEAVRIIIGRRDNKHTSETKGEVSHFQALTAALSATVGLGNISGVAIAIAAGGPGATFWMMVAGFLGMSSKFAECTLGVKYRHVDKDGKVSGGGMYYIKEAFNKIGLNKIGTVLSYLFALFAIGGGIGGGCVLQANQAFAQVSNVFPAMREHSVLFGVVMAVLVGIVIIGGIKSIAKFTGYIVPIMAGIYVITSLIIIGANISELPDAFSMIIGGAFNPGAIRGGILGIIVLGFQRSCLSNEAGIGSAPIAHSAVVTDKPITEGIVALVEPFIDTVVICTMTALVIIFTGSYNLAGNYDGIQMTSKAFESVFSWFPYMLLVSIVLFAFSTVITWSYYGLTAFQFLVKGFVKNGKLSGLLFQLFFLMFVIIGASTSLGAVIDLTDIMMLCMAFPNIIALYIMSKEIKHDLKDYMLTRNS